MSELEPSGVRHGEPSSLAAYGIVLRVLRSTRDPVPRLTVVAAVGLVVAAALAAFGMPPIDLHTPVHHLGIMDPACGMTRGAAATMRGDLGEAWYYNPASPLVILGGLLVVARWLVGRLSGIWIDVRVRATPFIVAAAGLFLVALEVNQQLHVARLR